MADETVKPAAKPVSEGKAFTIGEVGAPVIFFDKVPNSGFIDGIANIPLVASTYRLKADGGIDSGYVVVADLRCTYESLKALRTAIDNATLLAINPQSSDAPKSTN